MVTMFKEALIIGLLKTVGDLVGEIMVIFGLNNQLEKESAESTPGLPILQLESCTNKFINLCPILFDEIYFQFFKLFSILN